MIFIEIILSLYFCCSYTIFIMKVLGFRRNFALIFESTYAELCRRRQHFGGSPWRWGLHGPRLELIAV